MNQNLSKLYAELDALYQGIGSVCQNCQYHICEGYVWLLENEVDLLLNIDVPIVEINDTSFFIHSFKEENGVMKIEEPKPPCRLRKNGFCSIYNNRPFSCRLYPVNLMIDNDDLVIVLHEDCAYSRTLKGECRRQFFDDILKIFSKIPISLLNEIVESYQRVDNLSVFPEGSNTFEVITSLKVILEERGCSDYVEMQSST